MSTRSTLLLLGPIHIFRDVIDNGVYIDIGHSSYNHAHRIWPPDLKRLY